MKTLIIFILGLFIFSGCSTSSLVLNQNKELILTHSSNSLLLSSKIIDTKFMNFKDLFVKIYKLQDNNGRVLFYEDIQTNLSFEFKYDGVYSVGYIFDNSTSYITVYKRNNLSFIQYKLKNNTYINVIIQASDTQYYTYVYGFSNKEFLKIAKSVYIKDMQEIKSLKNEAISFDLSSEPATTWTEHMVYLTPLITPFRTMMGRQ